MVKAGSDITLVDEGPEFTISFADEGLVIDPTDTQVAEACNLGQWYGVDDKAADDLRAMLCGELSSAEWQSRRKH